jgi:hypothetical protein
MILSMEEITELKKVKQIAEFALKTSKAVRVEECHCELSTEKVF